MRISVERHGDSGFVKSKSERRHRRVLKQINGLQLVFFFLRSPKIAGWSFRSIAFNGAAKSARLGTACLNTLHILSKNSSLIMLVGAFSLHIATVVCHAISGGL